MLQPWRSTRGRLAILAAVVMVGIVISGVAVVRAERAQRVAQQPTVDTIRDRALNLGTVLNSPHIVFRSMSPGPTFGMLAAVPLADPSGNRSVSNLQCDRVYATETSGVCLSATHGAAVTSYHETLLGNHLDVEKTVPLDGIPSRARISLDGSLVSTTVFVTGHSYATLGFSTEAVITDVAHGVNYGNLEKTFQMFIDPRRNHAPDLNIWGVTFPQQPNPRQFYATVSAGGLTWLARGDLDRRTLTAIHPDAECPSISPNGQLIAYKRRNGSPINWRLHVLDLESGKEWDLPETRSIDDQVEWLNNHQVLYAIPSKDNQDADVWVTDIRKGSPHILIRHAASPAVVR